MRSDYDRTYCDFIQSTLSVREKVPESLKKVSFFDGYCDTRFATFQGDILAEVDFNHQSKRLPGGETSYNG